MSVPVVGSLLVAFDPAPCLVMACDGQTIGPNIGTVLYSGQVPVVAIAPYKKGIFTAFGDNRITWSPDGADLRNGAEVYRGSSAITAMTAYRGGINRLFQCWA